MTRRTLSGKRIDPDGQPHRTWHELVQPQPKRERVVRPDRHPDLPTPESLAVTEFPEDYRGGRAQRPHAVYSKRLSLTLGAAWLRRREQQHPTRAAQRAARRSVKAAGPSSSRRAA